MSLATAISNTIRRLNLQSFIMRLPVFGQALYDGISEEFNRVNDFRTIVTKSVVPNTNMSTNTIEDNEAARGIDPDITKTSAERIDRIIEAAQRDGNGGPDWLEDQIQQAGYLLYVILNIKSVFTGFQFGNHQFGQIQFGSSITYTDPRNVDGEIIASSPNGNIGGFFENFGNFQFGTTQFGVLLDGFAYPRPKPFTITTDPNRWGYFFFLSPDPAGIVGPGDLLGLTAKEFIDLEKLVIQLKHVRNWAIAQVEVV